jgi:hypothetical protein
MPPCAKETKEMTIRYYICMGIVFDSWNIWNIGLQVLSDRLKSITVFEYGAGRMLWILMGLTALAWDNSACNHHKFFPVTWNVSRYENIFGSVAFTFASVGIGIY